MKMNKVLVKLYVPTMDEQYDVWLPMNKKIYRIINLLVKAVDEFSGGFYQPNKMPMLYDKSTAMQYDINLSVKKNHIKNGTEIVLI